MEDTVFSNIIQFSNYINTNLRHFPMRVLEGIRTFLGYSSVAYTILNLDSQGEVYVSDIMGLSFSEERLNAYKEYYYQYDPFIEKVKQDISHLSSDPPKNVWSTRDFVSEDAFFQSEYTCHFMETGLRYQAVLSGRKYRHFPAHVVSIFKSEKDGNFTDEELNTLHMVGSIFISALTHYLREMDYELKLAAWKHHIDLQKNGVCIFSNLIPPDETHLFTCYKSLLFPQQTSHNILWSLTNNRDPMSVLHRYTPLVFHRTCDDTDYQIKLLKGAANISSDRNINTYIIMEISPEEGSASVCLPNRHLQNIDCLKPYGFTEREMDVLQYLQAGYSNRQIADSLYMSIPTVKTHIGNIFKKFGVPTRAAAISKLSTILQGTK